MAAWRDAGDLGELQSKGRRVVKLEGKQILLIADGARLFACNNRCPHEGYPLSEGKLGPGCTLTCNWHNWKFDLAAGETLVGGDRLRQYPLEVRDGRIWLDVSDPPEAERQAQALGNLDDAVADNDYERMAREIARYLRAGGDVLEPLRRTIERSATRFEYGMTHAYAAAADWLRLHEEGVREVQRLTALVEPIAHIAWDTLRERDYPYTSDVVSWDAASFLEAIEAEDERGAISRLNGALAQGPEVLLELRKAFAHAALSHYQDFGHSAIYVRKAFELVDRLGIRVAPAVLRALARSIVYASREDLIPEFRHYAKALVRWPIAGGTSAKPEDMLGLPVGATLDRVLTLSGDNEAKYRLLLEACAVAMLRFDVSVDVQTTKPVSHNVGWLDFTHALTFANAARSICVDQEELWPRALLQLACFLGRNAPFLQPIADDGWEVADPGQFIACERTALYDHGIREPIFACHRVKVLTAVAEEVAWAGEGSLSRALLAATNRYLHSPIKGRHGLRAAHQALSFVAAEG